MNFLDWVLLLHTLLGTALTAAFRSGQTGAGAPVLLDLNLVNTKLSEATGVGYTFTLPEGLSVATGSPVNGCGGTLDRDAIRGDMRR